MITQADDGNLYQRIRDLERQLVRERERAEQERQRAELAEMSMRQAWQLSTWRRPVGLEAK